MMRKACVIALVTLLLVPASFAGETAVVESVSYIPQSYYVGDRVELRAALRLGPGTKVVSPKDAPRISWGTVQDVIVSGAGGKWEIRILFTPYRTGTQTFPPFKLGEATVEGLKVHVRSLADEGFRELVPPRAQVLLPSTKLIFGLVIGGFIALPLAGTFLAFWLKPRFRLLAALYRERKPFRILAATLKRLKERIPDLDGRGFYIALLDQLKIYLSHKGRANCRTYTTREMENFLAAFIENRETCSKLYKIFVFGDEVKFGGREAGAEKRREDLEAVEKIAESLETRERNRVHL